MAVTSPTQPSVAAILVVLVALLLLVVAAVPRSVLPVPHCFLDGELQLSFNVHGAFTRGGGGSGGAW